MAAPSKRTEPFIDAMTTTVVTASVAGLSGADRRRSEAEWEAKVEKKVKALIARCKAEGKLKFTDPDFGPNDEDEFGARSLYLGGKSPPPAGGSQYPQPEKLRWDRPTYWEGEGQPPMPGAGGDDEDDEDEEEEEEEEDEFAEKPPDTWCKNGVLYDADGASSGDVVQGKLGDCWFLGALSVMATRDDLLTQVFFKGDQWKEYGLFVCRFMKDAAWRYVIIDDRIPVFDSSGEPAFARCKNPNELWVLLIEKAYAKLHGSYDSLIGGYIHYGLSDLTGFTPELIVLMKGHPGFHEDVDADSLWRKLMRDKRNGSLMGCSIQPPPKSKSAVEAEAGQGLRLRHAYGLIDLGEIQADGRVVRLLKLRNPWGFGEWTGEWSDTSEIRARFDAQIRERFSVVERNEGVESKVEGMDNHEVVDINRSDGTFFISFEDWIAHFTHLFIGLDFPNSWSKVQVAGQWDENSSGGHRKMETWSGNPKYRLAVDRPTSVFVSLCQDDPRLTHGKHYYKVQSMPVGFDVVRLEEGGRLPRTPPAVIPGSEFAGDADGTPQAPYNYAAVQVDTHLEPGEYFIVPSIYKRGMPGKFFISLSSEFPLQLEGGQTIPGEEEEAQRNNRKEDVREKLMREARRNNIDSTTVTRVFHAGGKQTLNRTEFKRKLMELGFSLSDIPDSDFEVLDQNRDGTITVEEFIEFFSQELDGAIPVEPPEEPEDDLMFQPIDLDGLLTVNVIEARDLRPSVGWFSGHAGAKMKLLQMLPYRSPHARAWRIAAQLDDDASRRNSDALMPSSAAATQALRRTLTSQASSLGDDAAGARAAAPGAGLEVDTGTGHEERKQAEDLHGLESLRKLEEKRTAQFRRMLSKPRRTRFCVDCGARPADNECTGHGCSAAFCAACWARLLDEQRLCEDCFNLRGSSGARKPHALHGAKRRSPEEDEAADRVAREWLTYDPLRRSPPLLYELLDRVEMIVSSRLEPRSRGGKSRGGKSVVDMSEHGRDEDARSTTSRRTASGRAPGSRPGSVRWSGAASPAPSSPARRRAPPPANGAAAPIDWDNAEVIFQRVCFIDWDEEKTTRMATAMDEVEYWFQRFDMDNDGVITFSEFEKALSQLHFVLTPAETAALMDRFDVLRRNGEIDYREFVRFVTGEGSEKVFGRPIVDILNQIRVAVLNNSRTNLRETGLISSLSTTPAALTQLRQNLRTLGVRISEIEARRVARVFGCEVSSIMTWFEHLSTAPVASAKILARCKAMMESIGKSSSGVNDIDLERVWSQFQASVVGTAVPQPVFEQRLEQLWPEDSRDPTATETIAEGLGGLSVRVQLRILLDMSRWNVMAADDDRVSYPLLAGMIRAERMNAVEAKLRLLLRQRKAALTGRVAHLVKVMVDRPRLRGQSSKHLLIEVADPFDGSNHRLVLDEDTSGMVIPPRLDINRDNDPDHRGYHGDFPVLTEWAFPVEEHAVRGLVDRLRLTGKGPRVHLALSESPAFVRQLKELLNAVTLPFFCTVSTTRLLFMADKRAVGPHGGIKRTVMRGLRSNGPLYAFLSSAYSVLNVVFQTIDTGHRHVLSWEEFVSHVTGRRNPYVALELLPDPTPDDLTDNLHITATDEEGGTHPIWNEVKFIDYKPPELASRPVIFTDIRKMAIGHRKSYLVLMVRTARDGALYVTAYDPQTACDYSCEGQPADWADASVGAELARDEAKGLQAIWDDVAANVRLAGSITPKLIARIYNKHVTNDEYLGQCEISMSRVLSNSGQVQGDWYPIILNDRKAGQIQLELLFSKKMRLAAAAAAPASNSRAVLASRTASAAGVVRQGDLPPEVQQALLQQETELAMMRRQLQQVKTENASLQRALKTGGGGAPGTPKGAAAQPATPAAPQSPSVHAQAARMRQVEEERTRAVREAEKLRRAADDMKRDLEARLAAAEAAARQATQAQQQAQQRQPQAASQIIADDSLEGALSVIRQTLRQRNPEAPFRSLRRLLAAIASREGVAPAGEVQVTLADFGVALSATQVRLLLRHLDVAGDGTVSVPTLIAALDPSASAAATAPAPALAAADVSGSQERRRSSSAGGSRRKRSKNKLPPNLDWTRLPKNWERRTMEDTGKVYFVNHDTRTSAWTLPADVVASMMPPGGSPATPSAWQG